MCTFLRPLLRESSCETPHALLGRDAGSITEVTVGALDVEVMRCSQLGGKKTGHRRFSRNTECPINGLASPADLPSTAAGNRPLHGWLTDYRKQLVEPLPAVHRLPLADKVCLCANARSRIERSGRLKMCIRCIVDVEHIDPVRPVTDSP